jgi:hypothetical protein
MRARWSELMAPHALERAYAFELTLQEIAFVIAPLLLSLVLALGTPTLAAIACAALVIAGALLFASSRRPSFMPAGRHEGARAAPMSSPAIRLLAGTRGLCSAGLGVGIVCIPAFAVSHGGRALTGVLAAVWSLGSLAGGAIYGAVTWRAPLWRRYLVALGVGTAPIAALPLAPGVPVFATLAIVSGLGLAAWVASGDALAQGSAPAGGRTEAFTWIASLGLVGEALGAVVAGILLDAAGLRIALAAAGALALASFLLALANAASLRDSAASGGPFSGCSGTPLLDA